MACANSEVSDQTAALKGFPVCIKNLGILHNLYHEQHDLIRQHGYAFLFAHGMSPCLAMRPAQMPCCNISMPVASDTSNYKYD